jgi:hypothetical protein
MPAPSATGDAQPRRPGETSSSAPSPGTSLLRPMSRRRCHERRPNRSYSDPTRPAPAEPGNLTGNIAALPDAARQYLRGPTTTVDGGLVSYETRTSNSRIKQNDGEWVGAPRRTHVGEDRRAGGIEVLLPPAPLAVADIRTTRPSAGYVVRASSPRCSSRRSCGGIVDLSTPCIRATSETPTESAARIAPTSHASLADSSPAAPGSRRRRRPGRLSGASSTADPPASAGPPPHTAQASGPCVSMHMKSWIDGPPGGTWATSPRAELIHLWMVEQPLRRALPSSMIVQPSSRRSS